MSDTISDTNQAPNLVRNRFLNLVQNVASYHFIFLQNIKCDTQSQNRPPVGRNSKHVSLQTTRLWGLSCTVRHAISKTTAGRSKFQIRVGTYYSCLEPASLRSQLPGTSDFPISLSFALCLLLQIRSISNTIVDSLLKIN